MSIIGSSASLISQVSMGTKYPWWNQEVKEVTPRSKNMMSQTYNEYRTWHHRILVHFSLCLRLKQIMMSSFWWHNRELLSNRSTCCKTLTKKIIHCTLFAVASGYEVFFRKSTALKLVDQYEFRCIQQFAICPDLSRQYNINQKFSVIKWVLIKHITLPTPVCRANALIAMY